MSKSPCHSDPLPLASEEFARGASDWLSRADGLSRRSVLKRMAAALALAGVGGVGCSDRPEHEKRVAQTRADADARPGEPIYYATTHVLGVYARGAIDTSREGRPIKLDGNPSHPSSLGGSDVFLQASILDLCDPTRSQSPTFGGQPSTWAAFDAALQARLNQLAATRGAGLSILTGTITSPTLAAQLKSLARRFPAMRWHHHDPLARSNTDAGISLAFGTQASIVCDFSKAKTIVSLDSDFFTDEPGSLRYARDFANGRRVRSDRMTMSRLYVAEASVTLTGSMADERVAVAPSKIAAIAFALSDALAGKAIDSKVPAAKWIARAVADLRSTAGASIVVAGESQPPNVHALVHAINAKLGNVGSTVRYIDPIEANVSEQALNLSELVADLNAGRVDTLLILGGDPVFTAPVDLPLAEALTRFLKEIDANETPTRFAAHLGPRPNATSFLCHWHLPEAHDLETWGDARGHDGTASLIQPLINPLFGGRSAIEIIDRMLNAVPRNGYEIVRAQWLQQWGNSAFEHRWQDALSSGVIEGSSSPTIQPQLSASAQPKGDVIFQAASDENHFEIVFRSDPSVRDGSFFHNAWLQEIPRPFTKLVWDHAAWISSATAAVHRLKQGDVVRLTVESRSIDIPVGILTGTPDGTVTLHLGYGQTFGNDGVVGVNAYALRTANAGFAAGATIEKSDRRHELVVTRSHHAMDSDTRTVATPQVAEDDRELGRRIVRIATLDELKKNVNVIRDLGGEREKKPLLPLYPDWDYSQGYQWGMAIDMTACMSCNACVVACQAENNIPVVGKEEVGRQREMHWLRIDSYFNGPPENPRVTHQPIPCMHCENAPCEVVCPVGATTHSVEGLNQMTYNRCVGTRYCSNNCPYKVRRFDFFDYTKRLRDEPRLQLPQNPEVTVRTRGVMEKCSYCVQRLQNTRIKAERLHVDASERARGAADESDRTAIVAAADASEFDLLASLQTACQQACPTRAIDFGSITPVAGKRTDVMDAKAQPTDYVLLRELITKPRTSYLGRITNPAGGDA